MKMIPFVLAATIFAQGCFRCTDSASAWSSFWHTGAPTLPKVSPSGVGICPVPRPRFLVTATVQGIMHRGSARSAVSQSACRASPLSRAAPFLVAQRVVLLRQDAPADGVLSRWLRSCISQQDKRQISDKLFRQVRPLNASFCRRSHQCLRSIRCQSPGDRG